MIPTRRFGRTEISMPILSLGGMRFQQSWKDLPVDQIKSESQVLLRSIIERAVCVGMHHIETARHYGTSERQLGWTFPLFPDPDRILQSKIPPYENANDFEAELSQSFERLGLGGSKSCSDHRHALDLLAIHGINSPEHLEQTLRPGGCMEVARQWQRDGHIGHVGFSTHASLPLILAAIESDAFDYVNLHWYFIRQDNEPAIIAAQAHDMGVFLISPTDKGGHLHTPSEQLRELCSPLDPIVFNDLFCLTQNGVHTISVGASRPEDLNLHLEAVGLLDQASILLPPILERLEKQRLEALGDSWLTSWRQGLPEWHHTPGEINLPVLLWLHNLMKSWGMKGFARARYGLLGNAGHWFPGHNADALDISVSEAELAAVLSQSPWAERIPSLLRDLKDQLGGGAIQRLQVE